MYNSLAIIIMHAAVLVLNREAEQIVVVCQLCWSTKRSTIKRSKSMNFKYSYDNMLHGIEIQGDIEAGPVIKFYYCLV